MQHVLGGVQRLPLQEGHLEVTFRVSKQVCTNQTTPLPSPIPRKHPNHSAISSSPRGEITRIVRTHLVVAFLVAHVGTIWVVVHIAAEASGHKHSSLLRRHAGEHPSLVPARSNHIVNKRQA